MSFHKLQRRNTHMSVLVNSPWFQKYDYFLSLREQILRFGTLDTFRVVRDLQPTFFETVDNTIFSNLHLCLDMLLMIGTFSESNFLSHLSGKESPEIIEHLLSRCDLHKILHYVALSRKMLQRVLERVPTGLQIRFRPVCVQAYYGVLAQMYDVSIISLLLRWPDKYDWFYKHRTWTPAQAKYLSNRQRGAITVLLFLQKKYGKHMFCKGVMHKIINFYIF